MSDRVINLLSNLMRFTSFLMHFEFPPKPELPETVPVFDVTYQNWREFDDRMPVGGGNGEMPYFMSSVDEFVLPMEVTGNFGCVGGDMIESYVEFAERKPLEFGDVKMSLTTGKEEQFPRFKRRRNIVRPIEPIEEMEIEDVNIAGTPSINPCDLSDLKWHDEFHHFAVQEIETPFGTKVSFGMEEETCFPVFSFHDNRSRTEIICCPRLEYTIKPSFPCEVMTDEWLRKLDIDETIFSDLQVSAWETALNRDPIEFSLATIDELLRKKDITPAVCDEITKSSASCFCHNQCETLLATTALPICCEMNSTHFDASDIGEFSHFFNHLEILAAPLPAHLLMKCATDLVVLLHLPNSHISDEILIDYCSKYSSVCVISVTSPPFVVNSIKWRAITSLGHISKAILPFFLELNASSN